MHPARQSRNQKGIGRKKQDRYEFLDRTLITIHQQQESQVSRQALDELKPFAQLQFYDREKMMAISRAGRVQEEINKLVKSILAERGAHPDGSNTECIAMDMFTEFLSKLDLEDFRQLGIERLLHEPNAQSGRRKDCPPGSHTT
jgi:hypothetical protein